MTAVLELRAAAFRRAGRTLFHGVSVLLRPGEVLCVLGPNGVGKTTLLRCLLGLERLHAGTVLLDGQDVAVMRRQEVGQRAALVPQGDAPDFAFSVREMVEMGRAPHLGWLSAPGVADRALAAEALDRLGIAHLAERAYPALSGGERQLVLIARALAQRAPLLVLDEPTAHLDFGRRAAVLDLVRELADRSLAVVMTTHDPDHAFRVATTVLLLSPGQPAALGIPEVVLTETSLSRTYGRQVSVLLVDGRRICFA